MKPFCSAYVIANAINSLVVCARYWYPGAMQLLLAVSVVRVSSVYSIRTRAESSMRHCFKVPSWSVVQNSFLQTGDDCIKLYWSHVAWHQV